VSFLFDAHLERENLIKGFRAISGAHRDDAEVFALS
jgi:hypothetical protein